ncbi:CDP-glycerol--poly(glycerophosphate) glycerophosphotransferase [Dysgonomonas sp. 520]|nr:CDP-glycerol--poly(glycerophosphate) glycerophosphotransferase [Dysgonomonas sp. 520]
MNKYLLFVSHSYAYSILRPIQDEIWRRGDDVAWFIEDTSPVFLKENEKQLKTIGEVIDYNPRAVFVPGNHVYDFFPGIKVEVFHGFDINKRPGRGDHYATKGWFDLYCTQGKKDTVGFQKLSEKLGYFAVRQTGWAKTDSFFDQSGQIFQTYNKRPVILYSSTFTKWITSAPFLYDEIHRLIQKRDWDWLITLHPKMNEETVTLYKELEKYENVTFYNGGNNTKLLKQADVMVCDSSSIIVEFLFFHKPVVTYKNTSPGNHLINIEDSSLLESSIEKALSPSDELLQHIKEYTDEMHPYRDGKSSARILDAVDDFEKNCKGKLKKKPLNLFRKLKLRKKTHYFPFGSYHSPKK